MSHLRTVTLKLLAAVALMMQLLHAQTAPHCLGLYGSAAIRWTAPNSSNFQQSAYTVYVQSVSGKNLEFVVWQPGSPSTVLRRTASDVQTIWAGDTATCQSGGPQGSASASAAIPPVYSASALAGGDFNGDGVPDAAVLVPGTNQFSVYLGKSDGTFQNPVAYKVGSALSDLEAIAVADFNNDKNLDLAVLDSVGNTVTILLGNGDGTFRSGATVSLGSSPAALAIADFNGDGAADLAVSIPVSNTIAVILGNGNGTFQTPVNYPVGTGPGPLLARDFNGDGKVDLLVADQTSSDLSLLAGNGNGTFQPGVVTKTPAFATYLASADLNNDGIPDVVALSADLNTAMLFLGAGGGALRYSASYLVPNRSASVAIFDINQNGIPDLIVPDSDSGEGIVLPGNGDGTLSAPSVYPIAAADLSSGLVSLATGDFNGDGKLDMVVPGSATQAVLLGKGDGTFQNPGPLPVTGRPLTVAAGDFNRDGRLDLAVFTTQLNILLGKGDGTFQAGAQYGALQPMVVADFNGDGNLDLAGPAGNSIAVMLGNGDGTFRGPVNYTTGSHPSVVVAADFNHDGKLDLAVLNTGTLQSSTDTGGYSILLGNGDGTFQPAATRGAGVNPRTMVVADFNGDGKPDLAIATGVNLFNFQLFLFPGNGDGTFQAPVVIPSLPGSTPSAMAAADVNGDGKMDLVIANCCGDSSGYYFLGNGDATLQTPVRFFQGADARAMALADFNGDGRPDIALANFPLATPAQGAATLLLNHLGAPPQLANVSDASFQVGPVAPESIVAAFGVNLTTATVAASSADLPTALNSTTVAVKDSAGVSRLAPLYFISPSQINYVVPSGTATGPAIVTIAAPNQTTVSPPVQIAGVAPGVFFIPNSGNLPAAGLTRVSGAAVTQDIVTAAPIDLGPSSDQVYLILYGTGIRFHSATGTVSATIGGVNAPVLYAGSQNQYAGLDQVNVQIPRTLAGRGTVTVALTVDGIAANTVTITIK